MSYILHTESGQKFEIGNKTAEQVKEEIKAAGLTIGNVTIARLVQGQMTQASGFELVETLSEEEQQEQDRALEQTKTETALKANEEVVQDADANQTTAPGVVTGGENAENAESTVAAPADTVQEVAPNLPNPTDAPHAEGEDVSASLLTDTGAVRSPETSVTEPAGEPVLTVSEEPHTESTLTQPTNADGTTAAPDVAATDVNDVNAAAPAEQLGSNLETDLNPNNAAAEQQANVETTVVDGQLEETSTADKVDANAEAHGMDNIVNKDKSLEGVDPSQLNEVAKDPAIEKRTQDSNSNSVDPDAVRRRMLGNRVADALNEVDNSKDDATLAAAEKKLKATNVTPSTGDSERKRRHNRREDTVEEARGGKHGQVIKDIEEKVTPKLTLNYVNPDQRWFEFVVADKVDPAKPHARTNTYLDFAPLKEGGYQFGLYVNGKSMKSTIKRGKVGKGEDVVAALNAWLPDALKQAGV